MLVEVLVVHLREILPVRLRLGEAYQVDELLLLPGELAPGIHVERSGIYAAVALAGIVVNFPWVCENAQSRIVMNALPVS